MSGATETTDGTQGMVPKPTTNDKDKFLKGDGTWTTVDPGSPIVDITKEDFNKLSEDEKNKGIYHIIDAGEFGDASEIDYDNTTSGLSSTKVQGAIDELKNITNPETLLRVETVTSERISFTNTTRVFEIDIPIIDEYKYIGLLTWETEGTGRSHVYTYGIASDITTNKITMSVRNDSTNEVDVAGRFTLLYVKTS